MARRINFDTLNYSPPPLKEGRREQNNAPSQPSYHPHHWDYVPLGTHHCFTRRARLRARFEGVCDWYNDVDRRLNDFFDSVENGVKSMGDTIAEAFEELARFFRLR